MAYRTLESVLHPDSHLALPTAELPQRPVRVMVTILEDAGALMSEDDETTRPVTRLRSPRLVRPEQAADFAKEVIGETDASL